MRFSTGSALWIVAPYRRVKFSCRVCYSAIKERICKIKVCSTGYCISELTAFTSRCWVHIKLKWVHINFIWVHRKLKWVHRNLKWVHIKLKLVHIKLKWVHIKLRWVHRKIKWVHIKLKWVHRKLKWSIES